MGQEKKMNAYLFSEMGLSSDLLLPNTETKIKLVLLYSPQKVHLRGLGWL